jgi:hypothetical protein
MSANCESFHSGDIGGFAVPITAIIMDFRRRRLHSGERRAMIEKGMVPPMVDEVRIRGCAPGIRLPSGPQSAQRHYPAGLWNSAWGGLLSGELRPDGTFLPHPARGGYWRLDRRFLGIGNLIYYAITGKKET